MFKEEFVYQNANMIPYCSCNNSMKKEKIQSKNSNEELGKKLFYECYGSKVCLDRNFGKEYARCNISKDLEIKWKKDILEMLEEQITVLDGNSKTSAIIYYLQIVSQEKQINKLVEILKERNLDSFSRLLISEMLSEIYDKSSNTLNKMYIKKVIDDNIQILKNAKIIIHESYKKSEFLDEKHFSEDAVKSPIKKIQSKFLC